MDCGDYSARRGSMAAAEQVGTLGASLLKPDETVFEMLLLQNLTEYMPLQLRPFESHERMVTRKIELVEGTLA